jgi:hypothetical protein
MRMTSTRNQQVRRNRAKAALSVIKATLKPRMKRQTEAEQQGERLRRLLTDYPRFSASFDRWMESRLAQIKGLKIRVRPYP